MTSADTSPRLAGSAAAKTKPNLRLPAETGVVVALAVLVGLLGWLQRPFLEPANLFALLEQAALPGIVAVGMVFVLTIREIDLSVGAMFHLTAVVAAVLIAAGVDPWLSAFAGVALGMCLGLANGLLALALRVPVIAVTLGTWWMADGLSSVIGKGQAIAPSTGEGNFFPALSGKVFGLVPASVVIFILLAVTLQTVLHRTRFGYRVQATGSNPEAAAHAGIATATVRLMALALMGAVAGLAGVIHLGAQGTVAPADGNGLALFAITAALLGGTRLSGGHGSVIGAAIGALVIQVALSGMALLGVDGAWESFAIGALLVAALAADYLGRIWRSHRAERRLATRRG
ncbi:ABC transporter permease [Mesorhizobium sp. GbtcB19]|uniref:ABC transporter permease n=1 Tax=Mesorhizobium sp. GbtcB19 TaxID=2824764 RepID=UPI001C30BCA5|nr:ABC transporter permease [Mesorhizobium sp. GbtcB19]